MWKVGDKFTLLRGFTVTRGGHSFREFCTDSYKNQRELTVVDIGRTQVYTVDGDNMWEFLFEDIMPASLENE